METGQEVNAFVNAYCSLRDRQYAVYAGCAKAHRLTVNELFVLDILWFSPEGQTQKEICDRLSANKQTIARLGTEKMDALVRLTAEFTENMEQEFSEPAARPKGRTGR